ncbi:MAG: TetR/AcrR family transcriptional regulator [Bacillota bacterium]
MDVNQNLKTKYPKLFEASMNEFCQNTYENASLNRILKNAEMSKGSFYHHIGDKFNLYLMLISYIGFRKTEFIKTAYQRYEMPKSIFDKMKLLCVIGCDFLSEEPNLHKFNKQFVKEPHDFLKEVYSHFDFMRQDTWKELLDEGYKNGEIRNDMPREIIETFIENTFKGITNLFKEGMDIKDYKKIGFSHIELIKDAISTK